MKSTQGYAYAAVIVIASTVIIFRFLLTDQVSLSGSFTCINNVDKIRIYFLTQESEQTELKNFGSYVLDFTAFYLERFSPVSTLHHDISYFNRFS